MQGEHGDRPCESIQVSWDIRIPLRDGVGLSATLYKPAELTAPRPVIFTLTPYIAQTWHEQGLYFASHGYPFMAVDTRGRGNSEGRFQPLINEAADGHDVVEWLAEQPYCDGRVAMWGGSYGGYDQWATAKESPPHLATIVPVASAYVAVDFPIRNNMPRPYLMQWLTFVSGNALQDRVFYDAAFWREQFRRWFESGAPFNQLDSFLGNPSTAFQDWVAHPQQEPYWDRYNPTAEQYAKLTLPILTITGIYDADQAGALMHFRQHMEHAPVAARDRHFLVIGPWDHAGTRAPQLKFCGLAVGPASLVDLPKLHLQWYAWTMEGGPKPEVLRKNVAYYVMGSEKWRYTNTLEEATATTRRLYLHSKSNAIDVFQSGSLEAVAPIESTADHYTYDPRDTSLAELESLIDPEDRTDQRMLHAAHGKRLVYHSAPFERDTEITGFFALTVWLSIDRADTDFRASICEVRLDGESIELTRDSLRARYREGLRQARLISTAHPLRYDFQHFMFVSREISKGSRLRLVIGPINSIYAQKNHNSGGVVAGESRADAQPVTVRLFHDESHPSALVVPFGRPEREDEHRL